LQFRWHGSRTGAGVQGGAQPPWRCAVAVGGRRPPPQCAVPFPAIPETRLCHPACNEACHWACNATPAGGAYVPAGAPTVRCIRLFARSLIYLGMSSRRVPSPARIAARAS
jgi:hypothetical protein